MDSKTSGRRQLLMLCAVVWIWFFLCTNADAAHGVPNVSETVNTAQGAVLAEIDSIHREEHGWSVTFQLSETIDGANAWCARYDAGGRYLGAEKKALVPGKQTLNFDVENASALFMVLDNAMTPLCSAKRAGYIGEGLPISYEVHFLLDSDQVLDEDHLLKKEVRNEYAVGKKYKSFGLAYLETNDRQFNREGWINRIRMREDKPEKGFGLTNKKRYAVPGNDVTSVIRSAEKEGFLLSDEMWSLEVEWGYSDMTLSISAERTEEAGEYTSIAELNPADAIAMVQKNLPTEEKDWKAASWGINMLETAQMVGPVFFKRYTGEYEGTEVQIEVWEIRGAESDKYITEISFKAQDYEEAVTLREKLMESLDHQGILVKKDSLKTQQILDAFLQRE